MLEKNSRLFFAEQRGVWKMLRFSVFSLRFFCSISPKVWLVPLFHRFPAGKIDGRNGTFLSVRSDIARVSPRLLLTSSLLLSFVVNSAKRHLQEKYTEKMGFAKTKRKRESNRIAEESTEKFSSSNVQSVIRSSWDAGRKRSRKVKDRIVHQETKGSADSPTIICRLLNRPA